MTRQQPCVSTVRESLIRALCNVCEKNQHTLDVCCAIFSSFVKVEVLYCILLMKKLENSRPSILSQKHFCISVHFVVFGGLENGTVPSTDFSWEF